jgi:hypothetical protein
MQQFRYINRSIDVKFTYQPNQVNSFHVDIASEISQATRGKIQRSVLIKMINADVHCSILFILVHKFPDCMCLTLHLQ